MELPGLRIAVLEQSRDQPAQAEVLAVEHLEVQVRVDLCERNVTQHVRLEVGGRGRRYSRHVRLRTRGRRRRARRVHGRGAAHQGRLLGPYALGETLARHGREELVGEVEAVHGVLRVERQPAILGGDPRGRELARERGAADEERNVDAGRLQILGGHHHLLRGLHEQSRQPEGVGLVRVVGGDEVLRRHLEAEVDHAVAVVAEDDLDQILADVVDVALHGGQHDHAARGRVRLLHVGLEVGHRRFHGLRRLEHLGHDELIVVEEAADLVHAAQERPVDDLERRRLAELFVEVLEQAVTAALHDVAREALVQGERLARDRGLHAVAEVGGEGGHGIGTAVFQQVLGEPALLLGDRRVALEALGVDDRVVEPRLRAVVEEDAVEHLAPGRRQPERDVGDAENRLALG